MTASLIEWLRTSESPLPEGVRALRRGVAKAHAVATHRSIPAFMDSVVATVPPPRRSGSGSGRSARRIVEVSTYPLHPRQTGGQLRGWHLAEALTHDADTEVSILSLTTDPSFAGHRQLAPRLSETCVAIPPDQSARETALRLVTGNVSITDIAAGLMWNGLGSFATELDDRLDGATAAVLVQPYLVDAVNSLAPSIAVVCDEHNDELALKRSILPGNSGGRWLLARVDELEQRAVEGAALVTATTDDDLDALDARYRIDAPSAIVPNGVDTTEIEFITGDDRGRRKRELSVMIGLGGHRPTALFVGSGHRPNIDAGRDIIEVAHRLPHVDFLLAGRHSTLLHVPHAPSNVHLLGVVPGDLLDLLLTGCDVALNPMHAGSGSNLKLLTYLSAGIPVVSTGVGARGIDAASAAVHIADEDDLAGGITRVLSGLDPVDSLAGRQYVEEHCDWRAIGRRFAALVAEHLHS